MNLLKSSLLANAIFSTLTGLLLILFTGQVAALFDLSDGTVFLIIGAGLLIFAITVGLEVNRQRPGKVKLIIIQDGLWVLASLVILGIRPFDISSLGYGLIGMVALLVLLFGIGQFLGLKKRIAALQL